MNYFDTHCHLNGIFYPGDIEKALTNAQKHGVSHFVLPGTTPEDSLKAIEIAKKNQQVYACAGIHPSHVHEVDLTYLTKIDPKQIVAIGEVGIDLYRANHPPLALQQQVFKMHLDFATKHNKPVIIHMRDAEKEVYEIMKQYQHLKFVMHSYTASWKWAEKFLALGAYFSFSGIVTFKNAPLVQEVAKKVPHTKILVETDAPFLAPTPMRGKSNEPEYVRYTAQFLAQLRNDKTLIKQLFANSCAFFNI